MFQAFKDIKISVRTKLKELGFPISQPSLDQLSDTLASKCWTVPGKTQVFYTVPEHTEMLHKHPSDISKKGVGNALLDAGWFTIEDTPGSKYVDKLVDAWGLSQEDKLSLLAAGSSHYASQAKGDVIALVFGDTDRSFYTWPAREGNESNDEWQRRTVDSGPNPPTDKDVKNYRPFENVWHTTELPRLLDNPKVTSIIGVERDGLVGMLFTRAEYRFGELVWGFSMDGRLNISGAPGYVNPIIAQHKGFRSFDFKILDAYLDEQLGTPVYPSVFLTFTECEYKLSRGRLEVGKPHIEFHKVLYEVKGDGKKRVLTFNNPSEEKSFWQARHPCFFDSIDHFSRNLRYYFQQEPLFQHYQRLGETLALFRALKQDNGQLLSQRELDLAYERRLVFRYSHDAWLTEECEKIQLMRETAQMMGAEQEKILGNIAVYVAYQSLCCEAGILDFRFLNPMKSFQALSENSNVKAMRSEVKKISDGIVPQPISLTSSLKRATSSNDLALKERILDRVMPTIEYALQHRLCYAGLYFDAAQICFDLGRDQEGFRLFREAFGALYREVTILRSDRSREAELVSIIREACDGLKSADKYVPWLGYLSESRNHHFFLPPNLIKELSTEFYPSQEATP